MIKADTTDKTELSKAKALIKKIKAAKLREAKAKRERMVLTQELQEIADENRERWFGDNKSYATTEGRMTYKLTSEPTIGAEFDFEQFYASFPHLFTFKPRYNLKAGEVRALLGDPDKRVQLEMLDVGVNANEKFEVE